METKLIRVSRKMGAWGNVQRNMLPAGHLVSNLGTIFIGVGYRLTNPIAELKHGYADAKCRIV